MSFPSTFLHLRLGRLQPASEGTLISCTSQYAYVRASCAHVVFFCQLLSGFSVVNKPVSVIPVFSIRLVENLAPDLTFT